MLRITLPKIACLAYFRLIVLSLTIIMMHAISPEKQKMPGVYVRKLPGTFQVFKVRAN